MKNILVIALIFAGFTACQTDTSKQNQSNETQMTMPMMTDSMAHLQSDTMMHMRTYTCPMHPEVTSQKEGDKCPKCGMELVYRNSK
jgi:predicted RNA-binding Zn-ribbon protein involved in translation (DUF1610 family)